MPLDVAKYRNWARIPHSEDDPAIQIAWEAAARELEERTGWCIDPVTRTQYVASEPVGKMVLLARQPVTSVTCVDDDAVTVSLTIETKEGLQYASLKKDNISYPLVLTVNAGSNTLNPMLEMALLQRVAQHVQGRGDDTVPLSSDYWDRICPMMGKGIG